MSDFEIEGLEELVKKVEALASTYDAKDVEDLLLDGAKIIADAARSNAPELSGKLKKAIKAKKGKRRDRGVASAYATVDRKIAPHADLVEYGTAHSAPHPYFRPAVDLKMDEVTRHVEDGVSDLLVKKVSES